MKLTCAPSVWGGLELERSLDRMTITIKQEAHVVAATRKHIPELVETGKVPARIPCGAKLRALLDSLTLIQGTGPLTKAQKQVQSIVGELRWLCRTHVRITKPVHMLSCVAARASEGALDAALGTLAQVYIDRHRGLTFGGTTATSEDMITGALKGTVSRNATIHRVDGEAKMERGPPATLEGASDATWSLSNEQSGKCVDVYAMALTLNGAAVMLQLKRIGLYTGSSAMAEGLALLKLSDCAVHAAMVVERMGGTAPEGGVLLLCDAESALRTAAGEASVARLKHGLRRSSIVTQRVKEHEVRLAHLPDAVHFIDPLTKWVKLEKAERAFRYLAGEVARAIHDPTFGTVNAPHTATVMAVLTAWLEDARMI